MNFSGKPSEINRFLGQCDSDDPTNLPVGLAALAKNCDFGLTAVRTRDGINTAIRSLYTSPVTGLLGLIYSPESQAESFFQLPLLYQNATPGAPHGWPLGSLQGEFSVGSGVTTEIFPDFDGGSAPRALVALPPNAHMIGSQAYNNAWLAFSDLTKPLGQCGAYNLKLNKIDPYGMKPFGWTWKPGAYVIAGETVTPTAIGGNGHLYVAVQGGYTGTFEPAWPLTEGGVISDGGVTWKEQTPVVANALPMPKSPTLTPITGGSFAANQDVYVAITYSNLQGESLASTPVMATTTVTNNGIQAQILTLASEKQWIKSLPTAYIPNGFYVYAAAVAHGSAAPALNQMQRQGSTGYGNIFIINSITNSGITPQLFNNARVTPGMLPPPTLAPSVQRDALFTSTYTFPGKPPAGVLQNVVTLNRAVTFPNALAGSSGSVGTNPSGSPAFGISCDSYRFGEVQINSSGVFTFTTVSTTPFTAQAGQTLQYFTPNPQDANMQNVTITLVGNGTGSFAAGRDVYVCFTLLGRNGETTPGPMATLVNTNLDDAVLVTIPTMAQLGNYNYTGVKVYECDVPTGSPAPVYSQFALVGIYQPGGTLTINNTATSVPPPTTNTTYTTTSAPAGLIGSIAADTATGGLNASQGYRYVGLQFINRNFSVSGFTQTSVLQYAVDQNGWELGVFNIPTGPMNVVAVQVAFTVADGTSAGPFNAIGVYSPGQPGDWEYPATQLSGGTVITSTILPKATNTNPATGTFNFPDSYLVASTDVTDRLRVIWPQEAVDIYYSKVNDRIFQTGVPGFFSGHWVSLAADPESYYGDTGYIAVGNQDGEKAICVRDYRGTTYSLRERSGFTITQIGVDDNGNAIWDVQQRWDKVGPCGPRAVDVCGKFMVFVHRSGVYRYAQDMPEPELVSKEIPFWWQTINWLAEQTICVAIDEEKSCVRIQVPTGQSTVPNQEILLYYKEGWNNPIHFSTYSGHEISMDAARRYAFNDVTAFIGVRIERTIPNPQLIPSGDSGVEITDAGYFTSQFLYASSAPDGTVQAITPGTWADNGVGIDWQYETVCPPIMMANCKLEGANVNARGYGPLQISFLAGRDMVTTFDPATGNPVMGRELVARPFDLSPFQDVGITRMVPARLNERWRMRFTNAKQPGVWAEVKYACMFMIPFASGRPESQG